MMAFPLRACFVYGTWWWRLSLRDIVLFTLDHGDRASFSVFHTYFFLNLSLYKDGVPHLQYCTFALSQPSSFIRWQETLRHSRWIKDPLKPVHYLPTMHHQWILLFTATLWAGVLGTYCKNTPAYKAVAYVEESTKYKFCDKYLSK